jgi:hypothetical protein
MQPIAGIISSPIMSALHRRIAYAQLPKRRRVAKTWPSRQDVPTIVGPEPQPVEPDAENLTPADTADARFRELVGQTKGG